MSNILLGNLKLKDIVKDEYIADISTFLDSNGYKHTEVCADVSKYSGNYHIYDMPRLIQFCDKEKMLQFINYLKENDLVEKAFIGTIGVTYEK